MSQKKNEGILFPTEIRVVGSYTDRLLSLHLDLSFDQKTDLNLKATSEVVLHPKIFYERSARSSRGNRSLKVVSY